MGLATRDTARYTYAEYGGWLLIDGAAYAMVPAPTRQHQELLDELPCQVANTLQGKPCRPFITPLGVRLPRAGEVDGVINTLGATGPAGGRDRLESQRTANGGLKTEP